ncbi:MULTISPECIES: ABC transporter permease [unclassified Nocardioides]|uniref:ABC transporter permease n=1 Tax=unclassified Nocardioides TaxID=2615069 RepID=UPI00115237C6|nr:MULTISPECIES: ABC transporter permease [unclassified Nocardioides]TQK72887.1 rhamnose transport system permease protein [Nocardioides sp. SLBN-35]WGY02938.1 ABC transporter permease [Nocardioides sp. QY071]
MSTSTLAPSRESAVTRATRTVLRSRELAIVIVLALLLVVATTRRSSFVLSADGWRDTLLAPSILLLLAVGQMVVVVTRNVDLSVGSTLGITAYVTGKIFVANPDTSVVVVFLAGLAVGAVIGALNGLLVTLFKVPALVITLGTMYVLRGALTHEVGSDRMNAQDYPAHFEKLGTQQVLTIPVLTIIAVVVVAAVGYYLHTARGGRELYAIGSDPDAADLYGLPTARRVFGAFVLCGALAGLAGVFSAARYATAFSGTGSGIELQAVAAVVIGGVAIFGGSGTVWGAAIGAFLLVTINRALPILGISEFWQGAVVGALIIGSIVLDRVLSIRRTQQLVEARDHA